MATRNLANTFNRPFYCSEAGERVTLWRNQAAGYSECTMCGERATGNH